MFLIFLFIVFLFLIGFSLLFRKTSIDSKGEINTFRVNCPQCDNQMPFIRIPKSMHQALWGGWICPHCKCEMDGFGNEILADKENNSFPKHLEGSKTESIKSFDSKDKTPVERIFEDNEK